ncbi:MAG: DUF2029 domain-containing protein, partial [Chloroflexi bacterium]|nr:DUF2029 domain-containing protein [Chloroflexota bacterium]
MNRAARILVVVVLLSVLYATLAYAIYMGLTQYALGANDFYSRWAGARALFLRGENPYSAQVTREIQIGMYGRLARSDEDQVAFAYPLYTAFVAAPLVALPYAQAQALWMAFLIVAVTGGVIVLARLNDLALQPVVLGILLLGVIAFYPAVRGIFLGQFALVSFLCLALAFWAIQTRRDALAGVLLALATVKPQLAILLLPAIVVWAAAQRRGKIAGGAALTLFVLSTLALLIVPTWPFDFVQAIRDYSRYEPVGPPVQTFVEMLAGGSGFGVTLAIGLSLVAWAIWRTLQTRHASWQEFQPTLHLVAIVTTLTAGRMGTPDQMLLLFPWLAWLAAWLARKRHAAAVLALVALLVLPWFVFVYTLQGNTEHLVVTLALPFLTLAVFVGKEFATVRCKRRSPSASLRVNSAESRGSPWRTRLRILRSVAHYEHALVHIVRGLTLAILLAAFALRVYHLNERSIWYDEAFSVFLAEQDFGEIVRGTAADIQPPLYYFLLHIWQGLGTEPFVMRFLSVGLSLAGVALVFALTRRLFSQRAAVFAMLFAAILPFQIEYAQELRMYALLELALLVYFYSFVALSQTDRPTLAIVALAISGAAALYSQSLAVLTWIVPDLVVVAQRDWRTLRRLAMAQALSLVLFAPWLVVLSGQMAQVQQAYWTTPPGLANVLQLLIAFTTHQPLPAWFLPAALFVTLVVDVILALE